MDCFVEEDEVLNPKSCDNDALTKSQNRIIIFILSIIHQEILSMCNHKFKGEINMISLIIINQKLQSSHQSYNQTAIA